MGTPNPGPFSQETMFPSGQADESANPATATQPAEQGETTAAPEQGPVAGADQAGSEGEPQKQAEESAIEKRWKDTQRALSQSERQVAALQAQVDLLASMQGQQRSATPPPPDIDALAETIDREPGKQVIQLLRQRDEYWNQIRMQDRQHTEELLLKLDPEARELEPALQAVNSDPDLAGLPQGLKLKMAKMFKATFAAPTASAAPATFVPLSGQPAGVRRAVPVQRTQTNEERFAPWLQASGALRTTPNRTIPWTMTKKGASNG